MTSLTRRIAALNIQLNTNKTPYNPITQRRRHRRSNRLLPQNTNGISSRRQTNPESTGVDFSSFDKHHVLGLIPKIGYILEMHVRYPEITLRHSSNQTFSSKFPSSSLFFKTSHDDAIPVCFIHRRSRNPRILHSGTTFSKVLESFSCFWEVLS